VDEEFSNSPLPFALAGGAAGGSSSTAFAEVLPPKTQRQPQGATGLHKARNHYTQCGFYLLLSFLHVCGRENNNSFHFEQQTPRKKRISKESIISFFLSALSKVNVKKGAFSQ
jgi:hypothetical protein